MAVAYKEYEGTLTAGQVSIPEKADRRGIIIANNSDTNMRVRIGGVADATHGFTLVPDFPIILNGADVPSALISIYCGGSAKAYTVYEW